MYNELHLHYIHTISKSFLSTNVHICTLLHGIRSGFKINFLVQKIYKSVSEDIGRFISASLKSEHSIQIKKQRINASQLMHCRSTQ